MITWCGRRWRCRWFAQCQYIPNQIKSYTNLWCHFDSSKCQKESQSVKFSVWRWEILIVYIRPSFIYNVFITIWNEKSEQVFDLIYSPQLDCHSNIGNYSEMLRSLSASQLRHNMKKSKKEMFVLVFVSCVINAHLENLQFIINLQNEGEIHHVHRIIGQGRICWALVTWNCRQTCLQSFFISKYDAVNIRILNGKNKIE